MLVAAKDSTTIDQSIARAPIVFNASLLWIVSRRCLPVANAMEYQYPVRFSPASLELDRYLTVSRSLREGEMIRRDDQLDRCGVWGGVKC